MIDFTEMPAKFLVTMNQLKWKVSGIDSQIQMSFASLLQHHTNQSTESQSIVLENTVKLISFVEDPPKQVSVKEIFRVKVRVSASGGSPLPNKKVKCNVTKSFDNRKLSTEIFTSLANSNFNIQKTSFLVPSSKLDPKRTSAITDLDGIATLYLSVKESPYNSTIKLVCQSGSKVSSPSTNIKIRHPFKYVYLDKNATVSSKINFNKRDGGFVNTNVEINSNIKLIFEFPQNTEVKIKANDVNLRLISYDEVESLRKLQDKNLDEILDHDNNIKASDTAFESFVKFGQTLMRGVQTVRSIENQKKKEHKSSFNVKIENNTAYISNITVTLDRPGKYAFMFNINGVYTRLVPRTGEDSVNSFIIDIEDEQASARYYFNVYESSVLIIFYFLVLAFSGKNVKGHLLIFALVATAIFLYLVSLKENSTLFFTVIVYILSGLIALFFLYTLLQYFFDV